MHVRTDPASCISVVEDQPKMRQTCGTKLSSLGSVSSFGHSRSHAIVGPEPWLGSRGPWLLEASCPRHLCQGRSHSQTCFQAVALKNPRSFLFRVGTHSNSLGSCAPTDF